MKTTELNMLKLRAWHLASGEWLILIFIRTRDDRLDLLSEEYVPTEDGVKEAIRLAQERLAGAARDAGLHDAKAYAQIPGAKRA